MHMNTDQCINYLYIMAFTSGIRHAGSSGQHIFRFQAKGFNSTKLLPDLPKQDYEEQKGDLWKLSIKDFFGFTTCITIYDIENISIIAGSTDGWNIESIVTFAVVNRTTWRQVSADYNVYEWIDLNSGADHKEFPLSLTIASPCIRYLNVMAYTSDKRFAGSDLTHRIEMQAKGFTKIVDLPNLPKDDFDPTKGDLWKLSLSDIFGFNGCITKYDIRGIAILPGSNDGWNINSIVTYVASSEENWELSSVDLDVDRWVDQNSDDSYKRFPLTLVI